MKLFLAAITSAVLLAIGATSRADPAPTIHYAPAETLEHVDVALVDSAQREIDLAAYVLTDWPVIQALTRAADRGVKVRILSRLRENRGIEGFPISSRNSQRRSDARAEFFHRCANFG
jgi:phosphatidylserine/phosphatidylglycerophosphate/cardiolipin synthase-like enzyme